MKGEKDILKWLNNELSEQQIDDAKQSEDFKALEKIAHYSSQMEAPQVDAQKALEAFKSRNLSKKETKVRTLNFKTLYKVAAAVAIVLTSSYYVFFANENTFETHVAETETLLLPDNSEVMLNAASKLSFNKKTWKDKRDLYLEGEAFFKVSKGQKFSVKTDVGVVQVVGTQFNVKERDGYFEVQCYEGVVSVTHNNKTVKLTPRKTFRIINGIIQSVEDFNNSNPSWIQAESSFTQVPLNQVIAELERQYDVNISAIDIDLLQLFSGTFTHTDRSIALKSVTIPLKLSYKVDGENLVFYPYEGN